MLSRSVVVGDAEVLRRLYARLQPIGELVPGRRFFVPGTGRKGRVLVEGEDFVAAPPLDHVVQADSEIYVELSPVEGTDPERLLVRASVFVQPMPAPPAEHARP